MSKKGSTMRIGRSAVTGKFRAASGLTPAPAFLP